MRARGRGGGPRGPQRVVVAGAGLAAHRTAVELRGRGYAGALTVLGEEPHSPYDRPPLTKAVLRGENPSLLLEPALEDLDVDLRCPVRAVRVRAGEVELSDDTTIAYDRLVVATGAAPVALPGSRGGRGLRTMEDAVRLRERLQRGDELVVVGAGWVAAEVATAARARGCPVTVVEAAATPLAAVFPAEVGVAFARWYTDAGVRLLTGTPVAEVGDRAVRLADGTDVPAPLTLVAAGVRADDGWLAGGPVDTDRGVLVDPRLAASAAGVFAVGDVAARWSARFATRLRVQHWDDALRAPSVVAANVLGDEQVYDAVPYFWSEQFGRVLQYAGVHGPGDRLVWRGSPAGDGGWSACWLRDGRLRALLAVDRPRDLSQGRRLVERATPVDEARLADPAVPLREAGAEG